MKIITVTGAEAGQRLDKLLGRYLRKAPRSFLYKMMRKKNITLNGMRAEGSEKVQAGDEVKIFLSDETYEKFAGCSERTTVPYPVTRLQILYEDRHILLVNKPAGMLTQKAEPGDVSLNEYLLGYLCQSGQWKEGDPVRPSVCNRLDRNTSGIVICGKSLPGLQTMSELLRDRSLHKYYQCLVYGRLTEGRRISGWLQKDPDSNKVRIFQEEKANAGRIETEYHPLQVYRDCTLLEVCLITGRSHQIRAHLAAEGYPLIGDYKYGRKKMNDRYHEVYGLTHQLLHACRLELPELSGPLEGLSGKTITAELPALMKKIIEDAGKDI